MAISDYRFNRRSNKSVREQWGPTAEEERQEAMDRLIQSGRTPSSFGSVKNFESAVREEVNSAREARGPMAYDQSQGKMIPSPKARRERLSAWVDEQDRIEKEAEEYKAKNSDAGRTAIVKDWSEDPEVAAARKTGSIAAIEQATKNARSRDRVARGLPKGPGTPESDTAALGGKNISTKPDAAKVREVSVEELAKGFQDDLLEETERNRTRREKVSDYQNELVEKRLTDSGYNWKSAESADLYEDGKLNIDKAKRAADKAEGLRARATLQSWDDDKILNKRAEDIKQNNIRTRNYLRSAQEGRYGLGVLKDAFLPENQRLLAQLEADFAAAEKSPGSLSTPSFWRVKAETEYNNAVRDIQADKNIQDAASIQTKSSKNVSETINAQLQELFRKYQNGELTIEEFQKAMASQS